jgi:hypothetical protein
MTDSNVLYPARSIDEQIKNIALSSTTLADLKKRIETSKSISKSRGASVRSQYQRLFYFGRELKTSSRSLDALLGNYKRVSTVMHLHSSQPKDIYDEVDGDGDGDGDTDGQEDSDDDIIEVTEVRQNVNRSLNVNVNLGSSTTSAVPGNGTGAGRRKAQQVVDLLDSDSDDDEIEIVEEPYTKKARTS